MFIIFHFIGRALFTLVWLALVIVVLAVVLALMALALVSVICLAASALFGAAYWYKHDHEMASAALTMLLTGLGGFAVLVALEGMIWDGFRAVWRPADLNSQKRD